ncbi:hypothetical protein Noda2021_07480 [Candidatus Dependentiae bacterium Noda2021]|nr:hypothetical protein Noda2021_07480 [Candidatus Dependentiae bacterium Noda2021]
MMLKIALLSVLLTVTTAQAFRINRVIVASDANPVYLQFWPLVAKTWKQIVGIKPTLFLVAPADVTVDESLGHVIRFEPLPGIPTSFQAQVIRLLAPAYFEDDICIISDMDMIPLSKEYFTKSVSAIFENCFVVYKDGAFAGQNINEYPMCYNAAKGWVFKEIFDIKSIDEIPSIITQWYNLGLGWTTDQQILFQRFNEWNAKTSRGIKLGHTVERRVDRGGWSYNVELLQKGYYVDCHMLRPYEAYKYHLDSLAQQLGIE